MATPHHLEIRDELDAAKATAYWSWYIQLMRYLSKRKCPAIALEWTWVMGAAYRNSEGGIFPECLYTNQDQKEKQKRKYRDSLCSGQALWSRST